MKSRCLQVLSEFVLARAVEQLPQQALRIDDQPRASIQDDPALCEPTHKKRDPGTGCSDNFGESGVRNARHDNHVSVLPISELGQPGKNSAEALFASFESTLREKIFILVNSMNNRAYVQLRE